MSASGRTPTRSGRKKAVRKPPPHWRKYLTQAELELPPPPVGGLREGPDSGSGRYDDAIIEFEPEWWQRPRFVALLAVGCLGLGGLAIGSVMSASRDRAAAQAAAAQEQLLTLRAISGVQALRIAPNPRSWSTAPDATITWPDPPQLLELHLPVGYSEFLTFSITVDKVDHGRVMIVERVAPDSNKELRLSLNSSAFGPGEYRLRVQGYTWSGDRVDVGWVRLAVSSPST